MTFLARRGSVAPVHDQGKPPDWLDGPVSAVLRDLQGAQPIAGIAVVATRSDDMNVLSLGIAEAMIVDSLPQLDDDLDSGEDTDPNPDEPSEHGGGELGFTVSDRTEAAGSRR